MNDKFRQIRRVLPINATSTRKVVATSLLSEEERNLEKWPMMSSDDNKMTSSTLITQHYNDPATCHNNKFTDLINDEVRGS